MILRAGTDAVGRDLGDFRLALGILRVPYAWGVMALSLAGTAVLFGGLAALAAWGLARIDWWDKGWLAHTHWDDWLAGGMGSLLVIGLGWFAFPLVVTAVAGLFLEPLADRIERRHYPEIRPPRHVPVAEQIHASLRTLLRAAGWNLLGLPLYLVPGVNLVAYAAINGFLLSREYFLVIALRHVPLPEARALYLRHRGPMWRTGLLLALLFLVPVVNLAAPLIATAWMVHRLWRRDASPLRSALGPPVPPA